MGYFELPSKSTDVVRIVRNTEVEVALENAVNSIALSKQNLTVHRSSRMRGTEIGIRDSSGLVGV